MTQSEQHQIIGRVIVQIAEKRRLLACLKSKRNDMARSLKVAYTIMHGADSTNTVEFVEGKMRVNHSNLNCPTEVEMWDVLEQIRQTKRDIFDLENEKKDFRIEE